MTNKNKIILCSCIAALLIITTICLIIFTGKDKTVFSTTLGGYSFSLTLDGDTYKTELITKDGAESIVAFEKGKVIKNGDFATLITESKGYYQTLFNKQSCYSEDSYINSGDKTRIYLGKDFVISNDSNIGTILQPTANYEPDDSLVIMGQNRIYNNNDYDIFVIKDSDYNEFKQSIVYDIKNYLANGDRVGLLTNVSQINSIKYNGEDFTTELPRGKYKVTVTYDTNKTFDIIVFVANATDNSATTGIFIENLSRDDPYFVAKGTTAQEFLSNLATAPTVRLLPDGEATPITPAMINNFDTSKEMSGYFNVVYEGFSVSYQYVVFEDGNSGVYDLIVMNLNPFVEKDTNNLNLTFNLYYYNGENEEKSINDADVTVTNFDYRKVGLQEIQVTCEGITKTIAIYVYDENNNPMAKFETLPEVTIQNNALKNPYTFSIKLADGTIKTIPLTIDMLDIKNAKSGYCTLIYKTAFFTYYSMVEIEFADELSI